MAPYGASAGETALVRIPVTAFGWDCRAEITDMNAFPIAALGLKNSAAASFKRVRRRFLFFLLLLLVQRPRFAFPSPAQ